MHSKRESHFGEKIKLKISWPSRGVGVLCCPALPFYNALGLSHITFGWRGVSVIYNDG